MPSPIVPAPWADLYDVLELYEGTVPPGSENRVQRLLDYATARLRKRLPSLPAQVEGGDVDRELVKFALVSAVLRVLRNPGGYVSESAGEFSYRLDRAVASGQLSFTDEEIADLSSVGAASPPRARSIQLLVPSAVALQPDPWWAGMP